MNEKLKEYIEYGMYKAKLNKKELSSVMSLSYPTMLSKLKNPDTFAVKELEKLFDILNLDLVLTINK